MTRCKEKYLSDLIIRFLIIIGESVLETDLGMIIWSPKWHQKQSIQALKMRISVHEFQKASWVSLNISIYN